MSDTLYAWILAVLPVIALLFGVWLGAKGERQAWLSRAMPKNQTPHHCEGVFYYIIPENIYCRECHVRRALTEEGIAGTTTDPQPCELGRKT